MTPVLKLSVAAALVIAITVGALAIDWSGHAAVGGLPAPLTISEAQDLPDDQLVPRLTQDIGARLVRSQRGEGAWRELASPAREFWLGSAYEMHLVRGGVLNFLIIQPDTAPGLADIRDGYRALGAVGMADALDEAVALATGDGAQAVSACRDFKERNHSPPSVHPPGTVDPFTRIDAQLHAAAATQDAARSRASFARAHLPGLITSP